MLYHHEKFPPRPKMEILWLPVRRLSLKREKGTNTVMAAHCGGKMVGFSWRGVETQENIVKPI